MEGTEKGERRREAIIQTALLLFAEKGIAGTSVNDIVAKMSVAKGTFYYYFDSRDELVSICVKRLCEEKLLRLKEMLTQPGQDYYVRLSNCLCEYYEMATNPDTLAQVGFSRAEMQNEGWVNEFVVQSAELLGDYVEQGAKESLLLVKNPRLITIIAAMGIQGLWKKRVMEKKAVTRQEFDELLSACEEMFHMPSGSLSRYKEA